MLCHTCGSISLQFRNTDAKVEIRRYSNFYELRSMAQECDFCNVLHAQAKTIEYPDSGQYCKSIWGLDFFNRLLRNSPVLIHHKSRGSEHNVFISCYLDAENTPGYQKGPLGLNWGEILGGVYVSPHSSVASIVSGRPFESDLTKSEQIVLAQARYDECRFTHSRCRTSIDPDFMPRRVLDLNPISLLHDSVRLLIVPADFKRPYAALSYCWGGAQNLRLTADTLRQFSEEGVPLSCLPSTIRDACEVCAGLDIRYLWVCSLCIVQDCEQDWRQQSSVMGLIYNCSSLTISAAKGLDCTAGLFAEKFEKQVLKAKVSCTNLQGLRDVCWVRGRSVPCGFTEPTERRGWTLQENVLSRRLLSWGSAQISWQCSTSRWCQSGTVFTSLPQLEEILPCPPLKYPIDLFDDDFTSRYEEHSVAKIWRDLVQDYSRRSLTLSKDKLPAISGIAKWLSHKFLSEDKYLAGLWWSQLPRGLLWYCPNVLPADLHHPIRPSLYRAPSWSWASLDCRYLQWLDVASEVIYTTILHYKLSYRSDDSFGELLDGHLIMKGPIKQGWLVPSRTHTECFDFWDDDWNADLADKRCTNLNNALGSAYLDVYDQEDLCSLDTLSPEDRTKACDCLRITAEVGLLLRSSEERDCRDGNVSSPLRLRLGVVRFETDYVEKWWHNALEGTICLV